MSRARHLHHDGRVTECAYSLGLWTRGLGTLVARAKAGLGSVKKRQVGWAVAGSRRLRWRRGGAGCVCAAFRAVLRRGGRCPCCAGRRRGFVQFLDKVIVLPVTVQDWGHGPDSAARVVPQLQFSANVLTCPWLRRQLHEGAVLGPVLDMPVIVQRQVPFWLSGSSTSLSWRRCRFPIVFH